MRQSLADTLEVLFLHSRAPVARDTTAARIISEADQCTVLVGIELVGIRQIAHAVLKADNVLLEQGEAFLLGEGWVDAGAALFNAVVAVAYVR